MKYSFPSWNVVVEECMMQLWLWSEVKSILLFPSGGQLIYYAVLVSSNMKQRNWKQANVRSRSIADPVDLGPALQGPVEHAGPGPLGSEWPLMALSPHAGLEGPPSGALRPALACWPSSPVNWPWCPPRRTCCKVQSPRATPLHAAQLQPMYMNPMKLVIPLHVISCKKKRLQTILWHRNARVNSHQRWKQTRFRICFHLWCELTSTMNVTEWQVSWNSWLARGTTWGEGWMKG